MAIWAKHVREKFPQVDDRYPGSRRTARQRQCVVRIGVPRYHFSYSSACVVRRQRAFTSEQ